MSDNSYQLYDHSFCSKEKVEKGENMYFFKTKKGQFFAATKIWKYIYTYNILLLERLRQLGSQ